MLSQTEILRQVFYWYEKKIPNLNQSTESNWAKQLTELLRNIELFKIELLYPSHWVIADFSDWVKIDWNAFSDSEIETAYGNEKYETVQILK